MCLPDDTTPARVAPTRIYRWERDEDSYAHDGGMILRTDDDTSANDAYVAQYFAWSGRWYWMMAESESDGAEATEDAARRACELAVLHAEREP